MTTLLLKKARSNQVARICDLVNVAYRGDIGWTKETDIVSGNRCEKLEIENHIANPQSHFLIAEGDSEILSCICLEEKTEKEVHLGLFAVDPRLQGKGVGAKILKQAESYASNKLNAKKLVMAVVSQRAELISYYERRGYVRTGKVVAYPAHLNVGTPKFEDLSIEYLEKATTDLT